MEMIEKLKNGGIVQRLITYQGQRVVEHIQPNKEFPGTFTRYYLPSNRNKEYAVMQNYALELHEVEHHLNKK
jgi:hypothetical protein